MEEAIFNQEKKDTLAKPDKSSKGSRDTRIDALCGSINKLKAFYTTSSCSGRTLLIKLAETGKKNQADWLYVTHEMAEHEEVSKALIQPPKEEVWFRFEPMIMHIACKTHEDASKMLTLLHDCGMKRAGIIALGDKTVIEAIGNETMAVPVAKDGSILVSDGYIMQLVEKANQKMEKNWAAIDKINKTLKEKKHF